MSKIPHWRVVIGFCVAAIAGYALASLWVVLVSNDAALRGDVVGTWKSFAVGAFAFWLGASSGGKMIPGVPPPADAAEAARQTADAADEQAGQIEQQADANKGI